MSEIEETVVAVEDSPAAKKEKCIDGIEEFNATGADKTLARGKAKHGAQQLVDAFSPENGDQFFAVLVKRDSSTGAVMIHGDKLGLANAASELLRAATEA